MSLIIGLILIIVGYTVLLSVSDSATSERLMIQAFLGMGISIIGSIFLMFYIYKRSSK